jgi:hypothetical protein
MIQNSAVKNHSQHIMEGVFRGCPGDSRDVWYYDSRTGRRGVIVTSGKFTSEAKKMCAREINQVGGRPVFAGTGKTGAKPCANIKQPDISDNRTG